MTSQTVQVIMQQVTKTSTEWAGDPNVIKRGVICVELADDAETIVGVKAGIGDKTFAQLDYVTDPTLGTAALEDVDAFDPAGTAAAAIAALVAGASPAGDTLSELEARIAAVEALGSLATDAELVAAVADLIGTADADGDTLGELQALIGARLAASANLSDVPSPATARANLDVYSTSELDDVIAANATMTHPAVETVFDRCWRDVDVVTDALALPLDSGHSWQTIDGDVTSMVDVSYMPDKGPLRINVSGANNSQAVKPALLVAGLAAEHPTVWLRWTGRQVSSWQPRIFVKWIDAQNWIAIDAGWTLDVQVCVAGAVTTIGSTGNLNNGTAYGYSGSTSFLPHEVEARIRYAHTNHASSSRQVHVIGDGGVDVLRAPLTSAQWAALSGPGTVGIDAPADLYLYGFRAGNVIDSL